MHRKLGILKTFWWTVWQDFHLDRAPLRLVRAQAGHLVGVKHDILLVKIVNSPI